ncbi:GerMN domain-containing protein [Bacillus sp. FJAT-50079]|uniref:GerMN domain-containing protein n=1 Tax=Bacillus sp. FJAT-50079 TaxID=2833577 RepID=UPI001BC92E55|nr:GerMN domain-containing protein [Bacillus sp. FJAT-50079]MBS4209718.1 GerMN domain-containing protein [Bacillus sp. FJAT-50079]
MNYDDKKEQELIELFDQLPKIEDERSFDQLYRNVNQHLAKKPKKRRFIIPSLATLAALILFMIAIPTYFQKGEFTRNSTPLMEEKSSMDMAEQKNESSLLVKESNEMVEQQKSPHMTTAAYEPDDANHKLVTYGVSTEDAFVIPISMYVAYDGKEDWLSVYKRAAQKLDVERHGFKPITPMLDALEYEQETKAMIVTVHPDNRSFFVNNVNQIVEMLDYTLRNEEVQMTKFRNEHGEPVELGNFGVVQDRDIEQNLNKAHYLFTTKTGEIFIVAATSDSPQFSKAIEDMRETPNAFFQPLIPEDVHPVVTEENGEATVNFKEEILLDEGDSIAKIRMVEGILLTAKEFGYKQLQFENIEPEHWDRFDFTKPITVPVAANLIEESEK